MSDSRAEAFYTGLVADLYTPLKSTRFAPDHYRDLISRHGEPALELGCGDGDPLLDLRAEGLDVDGLDSSPDMINRLHRRAVERGLDVTAWVATMEAMSAPRRYRTVFLAGPTFNLLPDDEAMARALVSIRDALTPDGTAIVPLFVPEPVTPEAVGVPTWQETPTGWIGWQVIAVNRDEKSCTQRLTLRYERGHNGDIEQLERDWIVHWVDLARFEAMALGAGLRVAKAPPRIDHQPRDVILHHVLDERSDEPRSTTAIASVPTLP